MPVLTGFIEAAMSDAIYSTLEDGTVLGEIAACPGVWANACNHWECMKELREALEMWIVLKLHNNHTIPHIKGLHLDVEMVDEWQD